jgi:hypothetical protein
MQVISQNKLPNLDLWKLPNFVACGASSSLRPMALLALRHAAQAALGLLSGAKRQDEDEDEDEEEKKDKPPGKARRPDEEEKKGPRAKLARMPVVQTKWWMLITSTSVKDPASLLGRRFRRRYRVSFARFSLLVEDAKSWLEPNGSPVFSRMKSSVPVDIKVMLALRFLASGADFDMLGEMSDTSETCARVSARTKPLSATTRSSSTPLGRRRLLPAPAQRHALSGHGPLRHRRRLPPVALLAGRQVARIRRVVAPLRRRQRVAAEERRVVPVEVKKCIYR